MIELRCTSMGVSFKVKVRAGARRRSIVGAYGGKLKIAVTSPPEKGKANEAVIALIAEVLQARSEAVTIQSGHTANEKTILVTGLDEVAVRSRILAMLG